MNVPCLSVQAEISMAKHNAWAHVMDIGHRQHMCIIPAFILIAPFP